MTISTLSDLHVAFAERFNARDLDGLIALTEPDAVFVPAPGVAVSGVALRGALEQFLGLNLPITLTVRSTFETGGIALVVADWSITGTAPDGSDVALAGSTADVARFSTAGGWRFVIDNPFGTAR